MFRDNSITHLRLLAVNIALAISKLVERLFVDRSCEDSRRVTSGWVSWIAWPISSSVRPISPIIIWPLINHNYTTNNKKTFIFEKLPVAAFRRSDNCICTSNGLKMRFPFCAGILDPWNNVQANSRIKSYSLSPDAANAGDGGFDWKFGLMLSTDAANAGAGGFDCRLGLIFVGSETLWLVVGAIRLLKLGLFMGDDKCSFPMGSSLLDGNVIE